MPTGIADVEATDRYDNAPRLYDACSPTPRRHPSTLIASTSTCDERPRSVRGDAWATLRSATEHFDSRLARYGVISRVLDPARRLGQPCFAAGADVKVIQQMLGHKSATMTLDLYGHLRDDRLDEVADGLGLAANARRLTSSHRRGRHAHRR